MGNCQAIDNAALLLQHPNGKVEKLYSPVTAHQIMKINSGHYVALLLTTITTTTTSSNNKNSNNVPVRIRRIKLLKPTDSLVLGQIYRLVTAQEVMKGLCAKKYAKLKQLEYSCEEMTHKSSLHSKAAASVTTSVQENSKQVKQENHRKSTGSRCRGWHPSLQSISEGGC
ncbi:putative nucleobase-ascorbate transporter 6-like isoform X1 [Capsicum annuum]|uniref:uncharacterized protein LOC107874734 n=1 Tax=Capsicum annuum TaxID=4072 RepID=UPI0007BED14C|nr:uncharacterized protein LOC107874734 [Capsicum annuum]KAF3617836.1 putative nucleobase-ascorbate transporter 6-like isoform X1 [Capsicum annuum]KAF3618340.1 putative nucleobase-ascorbate transporter 6-like isoform X1 [Capsicum annuum]